MEKKIHMLLISILLSVTAWLFIDSFIVSVGFFRYLIIELFLLGMNKLSIYIFKKYQLYDKDE
jgi:hypothetical protein